MEDFVPRCFVCGMDLGESYNRQYCGKTYCMNPPYVEEPDEKSESLTVEPLDNPSNGRGTKIYHSANSRVLYAIERHRRRKRKCPTKAHSKKSPTYIKLLHTIKKCHV